MWIENSKLCLTNAAYEYFITQTGEKSKEHLKILWDRRAERPTTKGWYMRLKVEGRKKQIPYLQLQNSLPEYSRSKWTFLTFFNSFKIQRRFKGAMKSYFMLYSSVVIILFNVELYKSAFSTYSFKNKLFIFLSSVFFAFFVFKFDVKTFCNICVSLTCPNL